MSLDPWIDTEHLWVLSDIVKEPGVTTDRLSKKHSQTRINRAVCRLEELRHIIRRRNKLYPDKKLPNPRDALL